MISLFLVTILGFSALVLYKKRFTSDIRVGGLYFVQLYYLILSIVIPALLFNLGFEVYNRMEVTSLPIPSHFLFSAYIVSILFASIGTAIHSTSTSIHQSLVRNKLVQTDVFKINEKFHGYLSHNMLFLGAISGFVFLALLEFNHPNFKEMFFISKPYLVFFGIFMGIISSVGILRSAHIGHSLVASFFGMLVIYLVGGSYFTEVSYFPVAYLMYVCLVTLFSILALTALIFIISESLSKKVIKRIFPKGHPFHEELSVKILNIKIERDWL